MAHGPIDVELRSNTRSEEYNPTAAQYPPHAPPPYAPKYRVTGVFRRQCACLVPAILLGTAGVAILESVHGNCWTGAQLTGFLLYFGFISLIFCYIWWTLLYTTAVEHPKDFRAVQLVVPSLLAVGVGIILGMQAELYYKNVCKDKK